MTSFTGRLPSHSTPAVIVVQSFVRLVILLRTHQRSKIEEIVDLVHLMLTQDLLGDVDRRPEDEAVGQRDRERNDDPGPASRHDQRLDRRNLVAA